MTQDENTFLLLIDTAKLAVVQDSFTYTSYCLQDKSTTVTAVFNSIRNEALFQRQLSN